ncbi:MAG: SUMF1/EgtB/PvdO family nonheme iron enzyme, partial [Chthoniobacterales bacterium]
QVSFVTVGDAGNPPDSPVQILHTAPTDGSAPISISVQGYGSVSNNFLIGKYDITASQYAVFLNSVARKSDPYGLYKTAMGSDSNAASITFTNGKYSTIPGAENFPIAHVTWFDAARFCNWMHNGQPVGDEDSSTTEAGAYNLNGATNDVAGDINTPANDYSTVTAGAKYFIPDEDQWIKAAYYQKGSTAGIYWDYPTQTSHSAAFAELLSQQTVAKNNLITATKPLNDAKAAYDTAKTTLDASLNDTENHQIAQEVYNNAQAALNTAQANYNAALSDYNNATTAVQTTRDANAPQNTLPAFGLFFKLNAPTNCANCFVASNHDYSQGAGALTSSITSLANSLTTYMADTYNKNINYQFANPRAPYLTPVGTFLSSPGAYGTFDMGGNLYQWTSRPDRLTNQNPGSRLIGGGSWKKVIPNDLDRGTHVTCDPSKETDYIGFRIAAPTPAAGVPTDPGILLSK